jgi:MYXO-CTERM domain-containing protein
MVLKKIAVVAGLTLVMGAGAAQANIISPFETQFATDWVTAGVGGLRGNGEGDIEIAGVSGTVGRVYLYWHGPTNSPDPDSNASIMFNGTPIVGTNIGTSQDNNWGQLNSQAYRADVTSLVSGNGTYSLTGLSPDNSNGASLFVFYDDGISANDRDVVMFDGNDSNIVNPFDPGGWDVTLNGINYTSGTALMTLTVSDGQSFLDAPILINGVEVVPSGAVFQGDSVPVTPGSTVTNGGLWDILTLDVTSFLTPGLNSLNLISGVNGDALSIINVAIDLPAGAAPDQPNGEIPAPASGGIAALALGMLGLATRRRRRKIET